MDKSKLAVAILGRSSALRAVFYIYIMRRPVTVRARSKVHAKVHQYCPHVTTLTNKQWFVV